jgi:GNAT superfamily N-acetyltransferase
MTRDTLTRASIDVVQENASVLSEYARISIAFEVREILDITARPSASGRFTVTPRPVAAPWIKNYDAIDNGPAVWASQFDVALWTFFGARVAGQRVGGAAVVFRAPDVDMLAGRSDVALLWDIRVDPAHRGIGVGTALLAAAEAWAAPRGAEWLEVETQNINVPACRFYERNGFVLRTVDPFAYPGLPDETQLLWYKRLAG